jgi:hypothetical protein
MQTTKMKLKKRRSLRKKERRRRERLLRMRVETTQMVGLKEERRSEERSEPRSLSVLKMMVWVTTF